jgi:hypothetical protein
LPTGGGLYPLLVAGRKKIMKLKTPIENRKPHELNFNELTAESERLEKLLEDGQLTVREGHRLAKIRGAIEQLEILKYGV